MVIVLFALVFGCVFLSYSKYLSKVQLYDGVELVGVFDQFRIVRVHGWHVVQGVVCWVNPLISTAFMFSVVFCVYISYPPQSERN